MKVVHTSDWHLGAKLHDRDRSGDHAAFLAFLLEVLASERPDALIVSGDVFDVRQPTPAAQTLYYDFLAGVAEAGTCRRVVVTAGNHDSPSMLSAAGNVLRSLRVDVVARVADDPVRACRAVEDAGGRVGLVVAAVPFLSDGELVNLARAAGDVPAVPAAKLAAGFSAYYANVLEAAGKLARGAPVVATGHCTISGSKVSDERSERGRRIGGLESFGCGVFGGADYVALGHLHLPQFVGDGNRIRYSGSPLAMSFSEAGISKSVTVVEFPGAAGGEIHVREIPVPEFTPLRVFEGGTDAIRRAVTALVATKPKEVFASVRVTEGEGDLAPFWSELDSVVQGSGVGILLKENGRPRAGAGSGLASAVEKSLSVLTPLDVAAMRIGEESDLAQSERDEYVDMVRQVIGGLA